MVAAGGGCDDFVAETLIVSIDGGAATTFRGAIFLGTFSRTSSSLSELSTLALLAACARVQIIGMKLLFLDFKA